MKNIGIQLHDASFARKCQDMTQLRISHTSMTTSEGNIVDLEHDDMMQSDMKHSDMILRARKCRSVA